jgi:hypothetical protein
MVTGGSILSSDSLFLVTGGETPNALSLVVQGDAVVATGIVYGQGVRCVGGTLRRLYTKVAERGSILAPDFPGGDIAVSQRAASEGDVIRGGQSRWYSVFYRDPHVQSGCSPTSTFNCTPTGRVTWSP